MKRYLVWAAFAAFFIASGVNSADAKTAVVIRGIFGAQIAPMTSIINGLKKKGYQVEVREWFQGIPSKKDLAVGHSAGDRPALLSGSREVRTIDPTFINPGCQKGSRCINWHNGWDAFPFVICCGGYPVRGAENRKAPYGHVPMPENVAKNVLNTITQ